MKGSATEIVDIAHFLPQAYADWFRRRDPRPLPAPRRIMLIDDSAFFRDMLAPLIKAAGYQVTSIGSAAEALAAIRAGAGAIVTFNLKDFPPEALQSYGVEAQHPDEFVMDLLDLDHRKVCAAARNQRRNLKKPAQTLGEYLANLERQQLTQTRSRLQLYVDLR